MTASHSYGADGLAANALELARRTSAPLSDFKRRLQGELGWPRLTEQRIHEWEYGKRRVPASVLIAAAVVADTTVNELLQMARSPEGRLLLQEDRYRPKSDDAAYGFDGLLIRSLPDGPAWMRTLRPPLQDLRPEHDACRWCGNVGHVYGCPILALEEDR